jgi:aldose 1-epimerase
VDETLIPTGEIRPVDGTPFDLRRPTPLGERVGEDDGQLRIAGGYDHNFVLVAGDGVRRAARLEEPASGRVLEVHTTEPGLQLYTGNDFDDVPGKRRYGRYAGVALETQHFPDSPNRPAFPTTIVRPGRPYRSRTVYRFGVERGEPPHAVG